MKKKMRKFLLTLSAALLLVTMTVGVTVAYLTDTTEVVKNTFTVGNVEITLDEGDVVDFDAQNPETEDTHGKHTEDGARVSGNQYKLIPGREYGKDPTVHVADTSEDCWVFVKVENEIEEYESDSAQTIEQQLLVNWTLVDEEQNIYGYNTKLNAGESAVAFTTFTISGDAPVETMEDMEIRITAYAIQAEGFNTVEAAWAAYAAQ